MYRNSKNKIQKLSKVANVNFRKSWCVEVRK